jgi:uncharacterized protein (TIGR04562 family)
MSRRDDQNNLLEIPWEMMETFVAGRSGVDIPRLYVRDLEDARDFLASYGFDVTRADHRREMEAIRVESLEFIDDLIADEPDITIVPAVREETDVPRLLRLASRSQCDELQRSACSLLRVMHTFAHCGSYFQDQYEDHIRAQILDRFQPHIHEAADGTRTLGNGPDAIPLLDFQLRGRKSRHSLAMKLLHKAENVAADVFDWLGVRFVTRHRFDTLLVVRYLRENHVVMFANVKPGRSRNTLVDLERVRHQMADVSDDVRAGRVPEYERLSTLRTRVAQTEYPGSPEPTYNPYSSVAYHSIQFTCSQQIRVPNPHLGMIDHVMKQRTRAATVRKMLERFGVDTEVRFFFPYEVQIMDADAYERSRSGLASHEVYKARQRHAVKRRLWGSRISDTPPGLRAIDTGVHDELSSAELADTTHETP